MTTPLNFTAAYKYCRAKGPGYDIASVEDQFENRELEFVDLKLYCLPQCNVCSGKIRKRRLARSATFIKYPTTVMANDQHDVHAIQSIHVAMPVDLR